MRKQTKKTRASEAAENVSRWLWLKSEKNLGKTFGHRSWLDHQWSDKCVICLQDPKGVIIPGNIIEDVFKLYVCFKSDFSNSNVFYFSYC